MIQADLFTVYNTSMRKRRIEIVKQTLRDVPDARDNQKRLLVEVWKRELGYNCFCIPHILKLCSSPSGIDRDRRRLEVLKLFPRSEDKYRAFKDYKDEMSEHSREKKWSDSYD